MAPKRWCLRIIDVGFPQKRVEKPQKNAATAAMIHDTLL